MFNNGAEEKTNSSDKTPLQEPLNSPVNNSDNTTCQTFSGMEPEELQEHIRRYKQTSPHADTSFARSIGLVMTLGVSVVAVIYAGFWGGTQLSNYLGMEWVLPVGIFAGVIGGFWLGYILIKPFLREPITPPDFSKAKIISIKRGGESKDLSNNGQIADPSDSDEEAGS